LEWESAQIAGAGAGASSSGGTACASAVIPAFICPSDSGGDTNLVLTPIVIRSNGGECGKSNYVALAGAGNNHSDDDIIIENTPGASSGSNIMNSFNFGKNSKTSIAAMSDGTSNIMILGERSSRNEVEAGRVSARNGNAGAVWAGVTSSQSQYSRNPDVGNTEISKDWTVFGHMSSEEPTNWSINGLDQARGVASRFYTGGANVALGDGSVRFVSQDLNVGILGDLVRMADGNVVSGF